MARSPAFLWHNARKVPWRRGILISGLIAVTLLGALTYIALNLARTWAIAAGTAASSQMARTHAGLLASELQKYRLLPLVLTEYPEVRAALTGDPGAAAIVNPKLELLAHRTDTAVIYILDLKGRAVAASNWRLSTSFVGHGYDFRDYFRRALASGHAEQFALGAVSNRPGLFLARRINQPGSGTPLGVVVVKVELDRIEAQWRSQSGPTMVTNDRGVVVLTSQPDWRFRVVRPLGPVAMAALRQRLEFGSAPFLPLPLHAGMGAVVVDDNGRRFVAAEAGVPMQGWSLRHLEPLDRFEATPTARVRQLLFGASVLTLLILGLMVRAYEKQKLERASRRMLEGEVQRRTAELRASNEQLRFESSERERVAVRLRSAREELAQANRLGIIGQITAGVAHEVNQPAAAILTFSENALRLLERGEIARTRKNLETVVELSSRIGLITAHLRSFARRGTPTIRAVPLEPAIAGALLLLGDGVRNGRVTIVCEAIDAELCVTADRIRLEQILVNLLQNALEALTDTPNPTVEIDVAVGATVSITIADNGPGVSATIVPNLFTPFVTGKDSGLGLGLGIARDIAREFGGDLAWVPSPAGATFVVTLKRDLNV